MLSKFGFVDLRLLESYFKLNTDFRPVGNKPVGISTGIKTEYNKDKKSLRVILSVTSDDKNQPFTFKVVMMGTFNFRKMPPQKDIEKIVYINCSSIIFPYVRETIADITRRAGVPDFHLDPINFVAIYEQKILPSLKKIDAREKGRKR